MPSVGLQVLFLEKKLSRYRHCGNIKGICHDASVFGKDFSENGITVSDGDTLPLGTHTLHFVAAPMVRWPEVIVSYEETEKILFSADAFGKFGALDVKEDWADEARRYYIGIVGKYGRSKCRRF